ncbi:hypothetical protein [Vibrio algicola]|uniref:hypothetical protein n=1 Tax=Vibrio algicola TaxID=2662262 RepID=UPI0015B546A3|nr:hypothetical protein [Vibrio algicola]
MVSANLRLKELGGNRMCDIGKFYGYNAELMRSIFLDDPQRFDQMVTGFVQLNDSQNSKLQSLLLYVKLQYQMNETVRFTVNLTTFFLIINGWLALMFLHK